jgi:hypothetical protein
MTLGWEPLPEPFNSDFRYFLALVWQHLRLPPPTIVQLDIADYVQNGPRRRIAEAYRGAGKSWISAAYALWRLRNNPQLKVLVCSASKERADGFNQFCLRLIREMPILCCLEPDPKGNRGSYDSFDVGPAWPDQSPSMRSVGIFGQLTGSRADLIIPDDVETPSTSWTVSMRERLLGAVGEFNAILKPDGDVLFLGTPQTEETLYAKLLDRGYDLRVWPARHPAKPEAYGGFLAPMLAEQEEVRPGQPTDSVRFGEIELLEREVSMGRSSFMLQYMLDTTLSDRDRFPLRLSDLVVMEVSTDAPERLVWSGAPEYRLAELPAVGFSGDRYHRPAYMAQEWLPFQGCVMFIDPSGKGEDETAYAVVAHLNGYLFLLESGGFRAGYDDVVLAELAQAAKRNGVKLILIEDQFGLGMMASVLKPHLAQVYPCTIETTRSNVQKERRIIATLEPVLNQHRLIVNRSVIEQDSKHRESDASEERLSYQLFYQLTHVTKERGCLRHDDRLDALEGAVAYWVNSIAIDAKQAEAQRRDELWKLELDVFMGDLENGLDVQVLGGSLEQAARASAQTARWSQARPSL